MALLPKFHLPHCSLLTAYKKTLPHVTAVKFAGRPGIYATHGGREVDTARQMMRSPKAFSPL